MVKQEIKKSNSLIKWITATIILVAAIIAGSFIGGTFHPNVWTVMAGSPLIASTIYYIKCKCGGWFKHTKDCNEKH